MLFYFFISLNITVSDLNVDRNSSIGIYKIFQKEILSLSDPDSNGSVSKSSSLIVDLILHDILLSSFIFWLTALVYMSCLFAFYFWDESSLFFNWILIVNIFAGLRRLLRQMERLLPLFGNRKPLRVVWMSSLFGLLQDIQCTEYIHFNIHYSLCAY